MNVFKSLIEENLWRLGVQQVNDHIFPKFLDMICYLQIIISEGKKII